MLSVIFKDMLDYFRDKSSLFFTIFFPSILVFILGSLLQNLNISEYKIEDLSIGYYIDSSDSISVSATEEFLKTLESDGQIELTKLDSFDNEIGEFSSILKLSGSPMEITIYQNDDAIKNNSIKAMINSFAEVKGAVFNIISNGGTQIPETDENANFISMKDLGVNRSMIDYYAITMTVMIAFMAGGVAGAESFQSERKAYTLNRLLISPKGKTTLFLGKIIGLTPMVIVQTLTVMIISAFVFDANYSATVGDNIRLGVLMFVTGFALISISAFLGILFNFNSSAVTMPIMWFMMFFSGTFSREIYIEGFSNYLPPYIIQKAAFDLTTFGRSELSNKVTIVSLGIFILFLILGGYVFSKRRETK